jgi:hypothetical protein
MELLNIFDRDFTYDQSLGFEEFIDPSFGVRVVGSFNF